MAKKVEFKVELKDCGAVAAQATEETEHRTKVAADRAAAEHWRAGRDAKVVRHARPTGGVVWIVRVVGGR